MKFKYLCSIIGDYGLNISAEQYVDDGVPIIRTSDFNDLGQMNLDSAKRVDEIEIGGKVLMDGDILFSRSGTIGRCLLFKGDDTATFAAYLVRYRLRPGVADPEYIRFWAQSDTYWSQINEDTIQSTIGNFNATKFSSLRVPDVNIDDQKRIANFLDRETTRIDTLIEKKTRFIELLKEKRAAVITHAVTKGLDPDVPMREGSFKALGSVPAHWELSPVGRAFRLSRRTVGGRHGNFRLLSLTTRGIIERDISENFGKFPESFDTYQEVHPGNFVFCLFDIDETPRTVARSELTGMITGAYTVFDCVAAEYSSYILYLFLHLDEWKALKPFYTGLRKTIRPPKFTSIRIPFPPAEEAMQIAAHIETQTSKIDTLISLTERSIELLKEKRSALITAAVTGKIDVREAA